MTTPACKDCRFYEKPECRRFPPTVLELDGEVHVRFPKVSAHDDWCGEFKPQIPKIDLEAISEEQIRYVPHCATCGEQIINHAPGCPCIQQL
jgi:hypothetical protein